MRGRRLGDRGFRVAVAADLVSRWHSLADGDALELDCTVNEASR